jgi:biopolymer transport protein TolR
MSPLQTRSRRQRRAPMAEINVTPMVDVMLVLLIIFMVTAPLLLAGVPVNLPSSKAASLDQEQKPVQISLDRSGAIFVDRERVSEGALGARLARIAGSGPAGGPLVYLRADRGLDYGKVMAVMGEINAAGLKRLALVSVAGPEAH